ncbi:Maf-like protein [Actinobaculum suis]|uniref:Nucleoside triphosphate pyrophosphatase n=1 Tax=Actinobaculum suis TaxID=1657 RepID=A0A7Z8Y8J3_9ACTO|nr:Maf family nucleotide pyrophosphatase [Actinobaculum suis]VDG75903.1 Maf-like protein [Actinobaculum suis]
MSEEEKAPETTPPRPPKDRANVFPGVGPAGPGPADGPVLPRLQLLLASQSPARLATLQAAGVEPLVQVSHVDEEALLARLERGGASPAQKVLALASAKARAVAGALPAAAQPAADFVLGCDSMFDFAGEVHGKPHSPAVARERLRQMRGKSGVLHTGHCLVHAGTLRSLGAVSHARVHFAPLSDSEIDAYIATGEPLEVAGSFTTDGRGGPYIEKIDGDYHGVVGLSLPLLRRMAAEYGLSFTQFWAAPATPARGVLPAWTAQLLASTRKGRYSHGADGFMLSQDGTRHWGMKGAAGVAAFRRTAAGRLELLMQHRSQWSHGGGTWAVAGGAIEWDETPREGALREFGEETGIPASALSICAKHVADRGDWQYTTFVARIDGDVSPVPDAESIALQWVDIDAVESLPLLPSFAASWHQVRALAAKI